jgi:hypothetical protein
LDGGQIVELGSYAEVVGHSEIVGPNRKS